MEERMDDYKETRENITRLENRMRSYSIFHLSIGVILGIIVLVIIRNNYDVQVNILQLIAIPIVLVIIFLILINVIIRNLVNYKKWAFFAIILFSFVLLCLSITPIIFMNKKNQFLEITRIWSLIEGLLKILNSGIHISLILRILFDQSITMILRKKAITDDKSDI
jgi:cytochrome bd-type quinol oxidase subunit 2